MSHVVTLGLVVMDLDALKCVAESLGLQFNEGKKSYKWYGKWVNDYHSDDAAYKNGVNVEDYGKCEHTLSVKGNDRAYEVGVVRRKDAEGNPMEGFTLIWDFFGGGYGLMEKLGGDGKRLLQGYGIEVGTRQLREIEKKLPRGERLDIYETEENGVRTVRGRRVAGR